jgi:ribonuclease HII
MPQKRETKTASLRHEREYFAYGIHNIFGIDEAGRGAWAGPVSAGVVCLPLAETKLGKYLTGVRDSKQMTARQREKLSETIKDVAIAWGIGSASNDEIDDIGINPATKLAMKRALEESMAKADFDIPDALFLDSLLWPEMLHIPQVSIIGGDQRSLSIAAASVLAKTWRDDVMRQLDEEYPEYEFAVHKGYGTAKHHAALKQYGVSSVHRKTYRPVREILDHED